MSDGKIRFGFQRARRTWAGIAAAQRALEGRQFRVRRLTPMDVALAKARAFDRKTRGQGEQ